MVLIRDKSVSLNRLRPGDITRNNNNDLYSRGGNRGKQI